MGLRHQAPGAPLQQQLTGLPPGCRLLATHLIPSFQLPPHFPRDCIQRTKEAKGLPYLGELCLANCRDLLTMIQVRVGRGLWGSCLGEWVQAGLATTELLMGSN